MRKRKGFTVAPDEGDDVVTGPIVEVQPMIDVYSTEDEVIAAEAYMVATEAAAVAAIDPGTCEFCGANPKQPTRDGKHTCQCRREKV